MVSSPGRVGACAVTWSPIENTLRLTHRRGCQGVSVAAAEGGPERTKQPQ